MNARNLGWITALLVCFSGVQVGSAQTLLQRFADQLEQNLSRQPVTEPAEQPQESTAREALPPPRSSATASSSGRASLGIRVAPVTEETARSHQLVVRRGAFVSAIEQGSPAERAGLPLGAVIVAFDGRRIDSPDDLVEFVRLARPGQEVELTFYARDRLSRKRVQLAAADAPDLLVEPNQPRLVPSPAPRSTGSAPRSLEEQLGGRSSRPLLGRIGRALDSVVAPAGAVEPVDPDVVDRADPESEITNLRQQVSDLQKQVEQMRKSIEKLEKRLAERE